MTSLETARDLREQEEREAQEDRDATGGGFGIARLTEEQAATLRECHERRARETAAAAAASHHYYTRTFRGREAAQRVHAAMRAQLESTKENAS